jgi:hypothetical protein
VETLKIRFAVAVHPDGRFGIDRVSSVLGHDSEDAAMFNALSRFDARYHDSLQRYWVDVELPIPESPIPVHRATVTPVEPDKENYV